MCKKWAAIHFLIKRVRWSQVNVKKVSKCRFSAKQIYLSHCSRTRKHTEHLHTYVCMYVHTYTGAARPLTRVKVASATFIIRNYTTKCECVCLCVCVCSRNKQTRRSPKLRAEITLRATHSYTHTETHWSVGVVVGVVEKRGKGRKQRCSPWFRSRTKIFAKFSQEFYMLLRLVKVFPTLFALFVNCCCF